MFIIDQVNLKRSPSKKDEEEKIPNVGELLVSRQLRTISEEIYHPSGILDHNRIILN